MPRKPRKRLKFDEESVNKLLQEIYEDSHNIRTKIIRIFNKWETRVKDNNDIAMLGDHVIKLLAQEGKNQEQKINILKQLKEVVYLTKEKESEDKGNSIISSDRQSQLLDLVHETNEKKGK